MILGDVDVRVRRSHRTPDTVDVLEENGWWWCGFKRRMKDISEKFQIPDHPCMEYLPTKLGHLWGFYVGKYTSTMDDLGMGQTHWENAMI